MFKCETFNYFTLAPKSMNGIRRKNYSYKNSESRQGPFEIACFPHMIFFFDSCTLSGQGVIEAPGPLILNSIARILDTYSHSLKSPIFSEFRFKTPPPKKLHCTHPYDDRAW